MIEVDEHEGNYLDVCRHYRAIYGCHPNCG